MVGAQWMVVQLALYSLVCLMVHRWPVLARTWYLNPGHLLRLFGPGTADDLGRGELGSLNRGPGYPPNDPPGLGTRVGSTGDALRNGLSRG